jgi:phosphoglycerate dehydrogenase-like enzyme
MAARSARRPRRLVRSSPSPKLIDALHARKIAGAAIDLFDQEPLPPNHPFWTMAKALATPHIGYVSQRLYETFY